MEHLLLRIIKLLEDIDKKLDTHECVSKSELKDMLKLVENEIREVEKIASI
jgi:hypothetical protein